MCACKALAARVQYFSWTAIRYDGYCKVQKPSVAHPKLGTNQGYGYKLFVAMGSYKASENSTVGPSARGP